MFKMEKERVSGVTRRQTWRVNILLSLQEQRRLVSAMSTNKRGQGHFPLTFPSHSDGVMSVFQAQKSSLSDLEFSIGGPSTGLFSDSSDWLWSHDAADREVGMFCFLSVTDF